MVCKRFSFAMVRRCYQDIFKNTQLADKAGYVTKTCFDKGFNNLLADTQANICICIFKTRL